MATAPEAGTSSTLIREAEAYLALEAARWPNGPSSCPHCGATGRCRLLACSDGLARPTRTGRLSARRVWRCGHCRRQFSVLTGTVLERTKIPLTLWLDALRILSGSPEQPLAGEFARTIGVSAETARAMLHLVRSGLSAAEATTSAQPQG